jgi:AmiR/NasT family two-component response regulator
METSHNGSDPSDEASLIEQLTYKVDGLEEALLSRDVIGQAKGILMERFGLSDQAAFEMLVTSSQKTNLKLVEVARWLTTERAARSAGSSET